MAPTPWAGLQGSSPTSWSPAQPHRSPQPCRAPAAHWVHEFLVPLPQQAGSIGLTHSATKPHVVASKVTKSTMHTDLFHYTKEKKGLDFSRIKSFWCSHCRTDACSTARVTNQLSTSGARRCLVLPPSLQLCLLQCQGPPSSTLPGIPSPGPHKAQEAPVHPSTTPLPSHHPQSQQLCAPSTRTHLRPHPELQGLKPSAHLQRKESK